MPRRVPCAPPGSEADFDARRWPWGPTPGRPCPFRVQPMLDSGTRRLLGVTVLAGGGLLRVEACRAIRSWLLSVKKQPEVGSYAGAWRVREVACPKSRRWDVSRSRWSQSRVPFALPGPSSSSLLCGRSRRRAWSGRRCWTAVVSGRAWLPSRSPVDFAAVEVGAAFGGVA